jgi:hypothetical protein
MKPVLHGTGPQSSVFLLWGCRGLERLLEKVLETSFCNDREGFACFRRLGWLEKRAVAGLRMSGQASGRPHRYAEYGWPVCGVVFGVKHEAYCAGGPRWSKLSTRTMISLKASTSYPVSVRQSRSLQSRLLQCLNHLRPPWDLLMLRTLPRA